MSWKRSLQASALALLLTACGWHGPAPIQALGELDPGEQVLVADKATWDAVAVRYLRSYKKDGEPMEVSMELVNRSEHPLKIKAMARFLDGSGDTDGTEIWQRMEIKPGASAVFSSTSVSTKVIRYKVYIEAQ